MTADRVLSDAVVPVITAETNASLSEGVVPDFIMKTAIVCPLLKEPSFDRDAGKEFTSVLNSLTQASEKL